MESVVNKSNCGPNIENQTENKNINLPIPNSNAA